MNQNDEWYTPPDILQKVKEVLGGTIDLDPASSIVAQDTVQATTFFTKEDDGLSKEWKGKIWCNPPYSATLIKKFTQKFSDEYKKGNIEEGIMLTNSGTDTLWNQNISEYFQAYTVGRISFLTPEGKEKGKGSRGQVFTYVGDNPIIFFKVFSRDNFCWVPNRKLLHVRG